MTITILPTECKKKNHYRICGQKHLNRNFKYFFNQLQWWSLIVSLLTCFSFMSSQLFYFILYFLLKARNTCLQLQKFYIFATLWFLLHFCYFKQFFLSWIYMGLFVSLSPPQENVFLNSSTIS